jgi:hypothetical protein
MIYYSCYHYGNGFFFINKVKKNDYSPKRNNFVFITFDILFQQRTLYLF